MSERDERFLNPKPGSETFDVPDPEVEAEFAEAAGAAGSGGEELAEDLREHNALSPTLSGGDVDAAWEEANVGEESVGGENPTPDQDIVDELGDAMGIPVGAGEALHTTEELEKRDARRWELDPASAEDYPERQRR